MYRIRALVAGRCRVREDVVFHGGDPRVVHPFLLYLWLIEGEEGRVLVDTGPADVEAFNEATAEYIPGGIVQAPGEATVPLLERAGVRPDDVRAVLLTHFHPDHASNLRLFPEATLHASRRTFEEVGIDGVPRHVLAPLMDGWPARLHLVADGAEALPGIRPFWVGGHSPCSQAIQVRTRAGRAVLAGDAVHLYANIEGRRPIGWCDPEASLRAYERIEARADLILPGHDPRVLERHPGGVVG